MGIVLITYSGVVGNEKTAIYMKDGYGGEQWLENNEESC